MKLRNNETIKLRNNETIKLIINIQYFNNFNIY